MSSPTGSICHLELFAHNLEKTSYFYGDLFGWVTQPHDKGYSFWKDPADFSGGFTTAGAPVTNPAATFYIKVGNIPAKLKEIEKKGGIVVKEKTEIGGDNGFYALFRDLSGNNVGLWCNK